ncbi:FecR family protein [Pedobacter hiemivivus]|uniref:DUF4974 domain-containing protein n=1 Tax=Pedobacter hiemivivus TaxID=2530454 RepID=A0A4R0NAE2_9SPHI|nr:FecR family protein [Pedobacter hiemivivus]TCC96577.1 DUF4974 domain-containing protein [Pedobacter hiemivivus]
MTNETEQELLRKYREGKCSEEELAWIETWYANWNEKDRVQLSESDLLTAEKLMRENILSRTGYNTIRLWSRIAAAASIILVACVGLWYSRSVILSPSQNPKIVSYANNDVAPGKNRATIIFADGKTIALNDTKTGVVINDRKLSYNDGSAMEDKLGLESHTGKASMLTISTPRGGTYQVTLRDGTRVWLNAASKLSFSSQFSGKNRKVMLDGEAYFEVAKNKQMPFVVVSDRQEVEVLGTQFNVMAYDSAQIKTTLLEGSVNLKSSTSAVMLVPGEQGVMSNNGSINRKKVDVDKEISWRKGWFSFNESSIENVMDEISRWYDVDVFYEHKMPHKEITGRVPRNAKLSVVLEMLRYSGLDFEINDKTIKVK